MQLASLLPIVFAAIAVQAHPTERQFSDSVGLLDNVLLFDAPAFPDPANPANTLVGFQAFVSLRQIDLGIITGGVEAALGALGIDIGDKLSTIEERLRLFGAIGLSEKEVIVNVGGCNKPAELQGTSGFPDLGIVTQNVSAGVCGGQKEFAASVQTSRFDSRKFTASVFNSPNSGFGVISDIDDTVKISNVNDKVQLIRSTLLDEPKAVTGMPELYASLAQSLNDPQFFYVTGSPFQLYPFLNDFIDDQFSASKGPIYAQNLTLIDIQGVLDFAQSNGVQEYKVSMIDRIQGMYPNKKFLTVGDSTQKDPETYAEAFGKFGDEFISCIWIRIVDGSDNSEERFATAFANVPAGKFRIFNDADIPSLQNIDVAGGEC